MISMKDNDLDENDKLITDLKMSLKSYLEKIDILNFYLKDGCKKYEKNYNYEFDKENIITSVFNIFNKFANAGIEEDNVKYFLKCYKKSHDVSIENIIDYYVQAARQKSFAFS